MKVLLVDDEPNLVRTLKRILERKGFVVSTAGDGKAALELLESGDAPDALLTDLMMPQLDGMGLLKAVMESRPELPVVVLTGQGTIKSAVEAMKLGAYDYLIKPCNPDEIILTLERVDEVRALRREVKQLRAKVRRYEPAIGEMIGDSKAMREVRRVVAAVAKKKNTVLITGESGTGKELVAREIHRQGHGDGAPFIPVNCGALSDTLLESQLFGHRKGSFTGAISDHDGFFKAAEGGVLFLDEVSEMPMHLQVKLLRAVQQREVTPIGATTPEIVGTRIVAATNRDLEKAVARGDFREDLYYRLNVVNVHVPPLRDRPDDIEPIARHFIQAFAKEYEVAEKRIEEDALAMLRAHAWPGNARELQNAIERAFALGDGDSLKASDLAPNIRIGAPATPMGEPKTLADLEKQKIVEALRRSNGRKIDAARHLGIDRKRLYRKIKKYNIAVEAPAGGAPDEDDGDDADE